MHILVIVVNYAYSNSNTPQMNQIVNLNKYMTTTHQLWQEEPVRQQLSLEMAKKLWTMLVEAQLRFGTGMQRWG
jgi:hypothetical protein